MGTGPLRVQVLSLSTPQTPRAPAAGGHGPRALCEQPGSYQSLRQTRQNDGFWALGAGLQREKGNQSCCQGKAVPRNPWLPREVEGHSTARHKRASPPGCGAPWGPWRPIPAPPRLLGPHQGPCWQQGLMGEVVGDDLAHCSDSDTEAQEPGRARQGLSRRPLPLPSCWVQPNRGLLTVGIQSPPGLPPAGQG